MTDLFSMPTLPPAVSPETKSSTMSTSPEDQPSKKRKRKPAQPGEYVCDHPGCDKKFSRQEHLSRHKLNHNPTVIYECPWPNCNKSFVRSDLKDRHYKRHEARKVKDDLKREKKERESKPKLYEGTSLFGDDVSVSNQPPNFTAASPGPGMLMNWLFDDRSLTNRSLNTTPSESSGKPPQAFAQVTGANGLIAHDDFFGFDTAVLNDLLNQPFNLNVPEPLPAFFYPNLESKYRITDKELQEMFQIAPALRINRLATISMMERCIKAYWLNFHPQFPILHKPSFNTSGCPTILLCSMIMTGCVFIDGMRSIGEDIAEPLRWVIFASKDFQPPAKTYIIQALLLLERFEKSSSSRELHERAYIHHGTTIQLLRRTPSLGGHPFRVKLEHANLSLWEKWIEFETLKRTALYAFYMDSTHSVVFGHQLFIMAHQIQLALPCDDEVWESYNMETLTNNKNKSPSFLNALKKVLHRRKLAPVSVFGRKVLLAGLISIIYQMRERSLQGSFLDIDQLRESWVDTLSLAMDYWRCSVMEGCCTMNFTLSEEMGSPDSMLGSPDALLSHQDTTCKISAYHMAQVCLRVQYYDFFIYCGAPSRMNVVSDNEDFDIVAKRISQWASSNDGRSSVVYAYLLLFEMFLSPEDAEEDTNLSYDPNQEYSVTRGCAIYVCACIVWSYNFSIDGPECDIWENEADSSRNETIVQGYIPHESLHDYLRRVRRELTALTGTMVHKQICNKDGVKYHQQIINMANSMPFVKNKHMLVGMMAEVRDIFSRSYWEIGRESSNLINNCMERSMGKLRVMCDGMFDV